MVYATEKTMTENKDKLTDDDRAPIEAALEKAKKVLEQSDSDAATMKQAAEELTQASHKLAELMYQQTAQQQGQGTDGGAGPSGTDGGGDGPGTPPDDDVIDAEYEDAK